VGGHSFGGGTAIGTAGKDSRVKVCITMDAWLFPYKNEQKEIPLKTTPMFGIESGTWNKITGKDHQKATEDFYKTSKYRGNRTL